MSGKFFFTFLIVILFQPWIAAPAMSSTNDLLPEAEIGDQGIHVQPWFHEGFLDLGEDLKEAAAEGKRLVIIWEQRGCPYCKKMHEVNLRIPRIVDYVKDNFYVIQLNMWGDREVTDFDGEVLTEKKLANKYAVLFTPTVQFFPESLEKVAGRAGNKAEVVRIPGYFKPFHYYFLFKYAFTNGYEEQPNFQRWLGAIGNKLEAAGIEYDLWADELPEHLPKDF